MSFRTRSRLTRPAYFTKSAFIILLLGLVATSQITVTAGDYVLPDRWAAHPAFVLRPDGDRNAYFQNAGFDEDSDRLFVAQRLPYRWSVWDIDDHGFLFEAYDDRTDALLSRRPCIGLAPLSPPVDSKDHKLTTFRCDNGHALKAIEIRDGAVLGAPVKIIQAAPCRLVLLQYHIGTAIVDLDRGKVRSDLMQLFPKVDATIASGPGCIAYALVNPRAMGASSVYRIDLRNQTRVLLMRIPPIGNLYNPLFSDTFEVAPNGQLAVMSVIRAEIERRTTFGGTVRLELVDLKHRRWVRSLAESQALILGASWLDNDHVLYVESGRHIAVLDARTGAQEEIHLPDELIAKNGGSLHFAVSGDKRRLMFHNLRAIYVYDLPH